MSDLLLDVMILGFGAVCFLAGVIHGRREVHDRIAEARAIVADARRIVAASRGSR